MLSHQTQLVAEIDPLKYLLSRAALTWRLEKGVIILRKYDIQYVERKVIKGQVIADQLADTPLQSDNPLVADFPDESIFHTEPKSPWRLYFDWSHTNHGSRAGILFITPQGGSIPKSFRIDFPCTNNVAEYEALVTRLRMAIKWKIRTLLSMGILSWSSIRLMITMTQKMRN